MDDPVNHPAHYTQYEHEVIELTSKLDFALGNAVKYILRAPYKGKRVEDLKKARWYVQYVLDHGGTPYEEGDPYWELEIIALAKTYDDPLIVFVLTDPELGLSLLDGEIKAAEKEARFDELAKELEEAKKRIQALELEKDAVESIWDTYRRMHPERELEWYCSL